MAIDTGIVRNAVLGALVCLCTALFACRPDATRRGSDPACPAMRRVSPPLANVEPKHQTLAYWLRRAERHGPLDDALLNANEVVRHNLALRQRPEDQHIGQNDLLEPPDEAALLEQVRGRLAYMRDKLKSGELVALPGTIEADALEQLEPPSTLPPVRPEWRTAKALTPLRCGPLGAGLFKSPIDEDFDRNRCSTLRPGELVELIAPWRDGLHLARTSYALGWIDETGLSQALTKSQVEAIAQKEPRPLTRRSLLEAAFDFYGDPYGWGGKDGGYDCSRFLLDLFARFGIELPRHSAHQADAGSFSIDVSGVEDSNEKRLLLEAAARRGITLIHFPGHIMLYLGQTEEGVPMAMHAFSEYLTPCPGSDQETVNRVDLVAISDLSLGEGSSRKDFLTRATRFIVFGHSPGPELVADAKLRPALAVHVPPSVCEDSDDVAIFRSPRRPNPEQPLRVIATGEEDPGAARLVLYGPDGELYQPEPHRLDGPPHSQWIELAEPRPGQWTAVFGEGGNVLACERFTVARRPPARQTRLDPAPAWRARWRWERDTENLYAVFVEQLFREPEGEDTTWSGLQSLISDPDRNLLHDHGGVGEDASLSLEPDCADLPYFLRAYFAWKLRLPFAYRACTRGRNGKPPRCSEEVQGNLMTLEATDEVDAFKELLRRVAGTVHSASARTRPRDPNTDFYPLQLKRSAIRPGTIFADPYGHLLVVARWKPQGVNDYGVLIGADAQPDGTVGRRRFWRGSFLFVPETEHAGAGFKGWRPVRFARNDETLQVATNEKLRNSSDDIAWSDEQYQGTANDFYATMESMINPRPLDAMRMQRTLVDALEESVQRRINSVQNGEEYMARIGRETISMPAGHRIFETTGAWEDYSTPSRDMRLLISIDAVLGFSETVRADPGRFGTDEAHAEEAAAAVREVLREELANRTFEYTRSDGSLWELSLADLVERARALEMAYNPNDCAELRWGAHEGSEEHATCGRRAPRAQQERMRAYREWFATRTRPPR